MTAACVDSLEPNLRSIAAFASAVDRDAARRRAVAAQLATTSGIEIASVARLLELWPRGLQLQAWADRLGVLRQLDRTPKGTVALIAAGNMPVATWTAAIELLAFGAGVRIRPASGDPDAAPALRAWLADVEPDLARQIAILPCRRDDLAGWRRLLEGCSAVVVFGSDAATAAVAELARSLGCGGPVRRHGDKLSLGWLEPAAFAALPLALQEAWLDDALEAAWLADGRGCLSLRALLVPGPQAAAQDVARRLAARAAAVATRLPPGRLALDLVAARAHALEDDRLDAAMAGGFVASDDGAMRWAVSAVGPARSVVAARDLGPGARLLRVLAVDPATPLERLLAPLVGHLAALAVVAQDGSTADVAVALARDPLAAPAATTDAAIRAGFWRVCAPSALQAPPWHRHDGVPAGDGLVDSRLSAPFLA